MTRFKVGWQLHPQHGGIEELRGAWRTADSMGVDTIWTWDHFHPLYGEPDGEHFEGWSLLAAMACETQRARFGMLVTCNSYRNPELLADMARTIDHLSGGRFILGMGSGWFERDYEEYGYEFGTATWRLEQLEASLPRIKSRLGKLDPKPLGPMPLMIGGGGEKFTLRLVAEHADMWNGFGPPKDYRRKMKVLDEWCENAGRDPSSVERTILIDEEDVDDVEEYLEIGATHIIFGSETPFDPEPVGKLLEAAQG